MENTKNQYNGFVPPCGIYCGTCPNFIREKNKCLGAEIHCKSRKCKGIYICCVEKKGLEFCHQCNSYPCSRLRKFSNTWLKYGQDLLNNQELIKENGAKGFIKEMHKS
jgi:hypothetical protein